MAGMTAHLALELGNRELDLVGLTGSISVRDGGRSPSSTSLNSLDVREVRVGES